MSITTSCILLILLIGISNTRAFLPNAPSKAFGNHIHASETNSALSSTRQDSITLGFGQPTELPDSLDDAAEQAALAATELCAFCGNSNARIRVDFDTSVGDETFTPLKSSTEFMQKFTSGLCYSLIPELMAKRQQEMMAAAQARAELAALMQAPPPEEGEVDENAERMEELREVVMAGGSSGEWKGEKVRIYFPDEGNAALANRDWRVGRSDSLVPPCVEFASLGGRQMADTSQDSIILFFCPKASESDFLEDVLQKAENSGKLKMSVFVNAQLVDMGVTGFGVRGRMLRERLLDGLQSAYYLRTLSWGALTRSWPRDFTVWQEDEAEEGGYRMIKNLDYLPSNPEVEDIYDISNGAMGEPRSGGFLDDLGEFVQGMMRL